ncbi:eaa protein [Salmonella enterica subsp. enterica]|nr:eaa protein [Salmonella enterica subsp. enterica serovar Paratyphi C]MIO19828.1 eaa protein [Salmonella enterica subsp. enterica serovar Paratyphi C]
MATSDDMNLYQKSFAQGYNACRNAMLQGGQPVSNRDELQVIGWLRSDYNSDDKRDPNAPLFMLGSNDPSETWGVKYIPLSGNSPVIPSGWVMVPKEPTQAMIKAWLSEVANFLGHAAGYKAALAAAPQREVK